MAQKFFNDNELLLEFRGGHSAAFGHFAAASLQTLQKFDVSIVLEGGIQYNSIGRTALEARPAYLWDFEWSMLSAEMLLPTCRSDASCSSALHPRFKTAS